MFKRVLKSAWLNFRRNLGLSLVAVFTITITLLLLTSFLIAKDFGSRLSEDVKDKIGISIYFKDGVEENIILEVQEELLEREDVKDVVYTSRERALESFISRHGSNVTLMAALAEVGNPFQSSLNIISGSSEGYEAIVISLEDNPSRIFFEKVDYEQRKSIIESVFGISSIAESVAITLAIIMGVISTLVVFNVIRMAIFGVREEISIMRLVGASRGYLSLSFLFHGIILGIAGIIFSALILSALIFFLSNRIELAIPGFQIGEIVSLRAALFLKVNLLVALLLGSLSSLLATRRYLKR